MNIFENWEGSTDEEKQIYAQELLISKVTESIMVSMDEKRLTKADLARALGKSRAYLSQLLEGNQNMTLRTLADIAYAMGVEADVVFQKPDHRGCLRSDISQYSFDAEVKTTSHNTNLKISNESVSYISEFVEQATA